MSLAKAVISGTVYRAPEKRFTSNNVPISAFALNISETEETLVRVLAKGNLAQTVEETINKGDRVVVEGRLQNNTVKGEDGSEKRIYEIDANTIEKLGEGAMAPASSKFGTEEIVKFESDDLSNELIGEDEIPF